MLICFISGNNVFRFDLFSILWPFRNARPKYTIANVGSSNLRYQISLYELVAGT
jgi:hypothetical protein